MAKKKQKKQSKPSARKDPPSSYGSPKSDDGYGNDPNGPDWMKLHRRKDLKYGDEGDMPKPYLLLDISRQYELGIEDNKDKLDARTCKYWVLNPSKHKQVTRVVAIAKGLIRAIYDINPNTWEKCDMQTEEQDPDRLPDPPSKTRRWKFTGKKDREASVQRQLLLPVATIRIAGLSAARREMP